MSFTLPLDQMTVADKIFLMEALWVDLSRREVTLESPEWHKAILEEREAQINSGQVKFMDWEVAKQQLLEKLK